MGTERVISRYDFESDEEFYFAHWCDELEQNGYCTCTYHEETFSLFDKVNIGGIVLREMSYTPDFVIKWIIDPGFLCSEHKPYSKRDGYILFVGGDGKSYIDVKGSGYAGKYNNSDVVFPVIRKIMYDKYGIYVNKFEVSNKRGSGFDLTFTPNVYLWTKTGKIKKLHYKERLVECFS